MGTVRITTTHRCRALGCDVAITCQVCRRMAVYDAAEFELAFGAQLDPLGLNLVCACGCRSVSIGPINIARRPSPLPRRRKPRPVPLYVMPGRSMRPPRSG